MSQHIYRNETTLQVGYAEVEANGHHDGQAAKAFYIKSKLHIGG